MSTRQQIIEDTRDVLARMIRKDVEQIGLDDHLSEDLELDSMDAVDLVVDMKMETGVKFGQDDVSEIETVRDIVDAACQKLKEAGDFTETEEAG